MSISAGPLGSLGGLAATTGQNDPARVKEAAQQFEALLLSQMLKTARESRTQSDPLSGEDQTGDSMMDMAEQHLAQVMAANGGMGLAVMTVKGLERDRMRSSAASTTAEPGAPAGHEAK